VGSVRILSSLRLKHGWMYFSLLFWTIDIDGLVKSQF